MEKRKYSGKTGLKLIATLLALGYFAFCLYAGITGTIPDMQEVEHIIRGGHMKKWVSGGIVSAMLAAFCIHSILNDLNLWMWRKKSSVPFLLIGLLLGIGMLFLDSYLDLGWAGIVVYLGIFAILCGLAWIPPLMNQTIARRLLHSGSGNGRQQMQTIEWIHFYPLKKLLVFGVWGFGIVILLRGIWVMAAGRLQMDGEPLLILFLTLVLVIAFFRKMKRYICTPYHCVPQLNQMLTKNHMEQLMDGEQFERIRFQDENMNRYLDLYQSQNWMVVNGKLFSKKLALRVSTDRGTTEIRLEVSYLNGMVAKTKVRLNLSDAAYQEFRAVLQGLEGNSNHPALRGKEDQLAQKFEALLPDYPSEQTRLYAFLSQDVTEIRQAYIQTFAQPEIRKKKRSRRERQ